MLIPFREESAPNEATAATQRAPQVPGGGRTSQPGVLQLRPPQMLIPFREESAPPIPEVSGLHFCEKPNPPVREVPARPRLGGAVGQLAAGGGNVRPAGSTHRGVEAGALKLLGEAAAALLW